MYSFLRLLTAMSALAFSKYKQVFNGLTVLVYLSLMIIGQYYGQQLLKKMKQMSDKEFKRQLQKLTLFIILENVVLIMLLIVFVVRTFMLSGAKAKKPWLWFWMKTLEKTMEMFSIIVLSLTMLGDSGKKNAKAGGKSKGGATAPAAARVATSTRRAKKKSPAPGATPSTGGDDETPLATSNPVQVALAAVAAPRPTGGDSGGSTDKAGDAVVLEMMPMQSSRPAAEEVGTQHLLP